MKIYQNFQTHGYWTVIEKDGKHYYFDLSKIYRIGPECMGFLSDEYGKVSDWSEVYVSRPTEVSPKALEQCVAEFLNGEVIFGDYMLIILRLRKNMLQYGSLLILQLLQMHTEICMRSLIMKIVTLKGIIMKLLKLT